MTGRASAEPAATRVVELHARACAALAEAGSSAAPALAADPRETVAAITAAVLGVLRGPEAETSQELVDRLLRTGVEAQDLAAEIQEEAHSVQHDLRGQVDLSLGRLRGLGATWELLDAVCAEAIRSCGFSRVMLSWVDGDTWRPWKFRAADDPALESSFAELMEGMVMTTRDTPVEAQILEQRRPALIRDARRDPAPLTVALRSPSYVVAPITPAGRVLGLLHADHGVAASDEIDRDLLWTFAEGFGRIYERTELRERLQAQRTHVREALRVVDTITETVDDTEVELAREPEDRRRGLPVPQSRSGGQAARSLRAHLTPRERDVLDLIVRGCDNATIARQLTITEGTTKTHVSRILRKYGAQNRAALVGIVLGRARSAD